MPIGYTTYYAGSFDDLRTQQALVAAQEEATPERTLVLLELDLVESPHPDTLVEVNKRLLAAGVPPWAFSVAKKAIKGEEIKPEFLRPPV